MYCVNCGVRLAETEPKCPLCGMTVYHPEIERPAARPLYPENQMPRVGSGKKAISGLIIFVFMVPLLLSVFSDLLPDGRMDWSGYVAGGLAVAYVLFALPLWFRKPDPVVVILSDFAAAALYLMYIDMKTGGGWFRGFALPVTAVLGLIICTVVMLVRRIRRGRLHIYGGLCAALGGYVLMMELLMDRAFGLDFIGWSVYPMLVLTLLGGVLIYLAFNSSAREMLRRKLFF